MGNKRSHWAVCGILAAAVVGFFGTVPPFHAGLVRAQEQPGAAADDAGGGADGGNKAGEGKEGDATDEKKPEQKDPSDVRNAIGNMSMVRGFEKLSKPVKKGLWSQLVDQPYYTEEVRARKLLFFGQYENAEAKYNTLLKQSPENQEYIENDLEAILRQGHASEIRRFTTKFNALKEAQRSTSKMVRLQAEALQMSGKSAEARSLLKTFADAHPKPDPNDGETLSVIMMYGQSLEHDAQYAAAAGVYMGLVTLAQGKLPEDSMAATQVALALYRSSTLAGDGRDKHSTVMYELSQVRDRDATYWPAILAEAQILIACHNENDAGQAIGEVLDLNPNEIQAQFLSIDHAIGEYNFEAARQAA